MRYVILKEYENYIVYEDGSIWSIPNKQFLKPWIGTKGYNFITLCNNNGQRNFRLHRLVAEYFVPNPLNKPDVNHKDENKNNNHYSNLEWVTKIENNLYGTRSKRSAISRTGNNKISKSVQQYTIDNVLVNEYPSIKIAEESTKISNISMCCNGKRKTVGDIYGGLKMRYAQIRDLDISNGEDVGVSLFVQGCHFKCFNCFNKETWDFNDGKEWTEEIEEQFLELINRPYITRVSILGGSPLANENVEDVYNLIIKIKDKFPNKKIWLYTGYKYEDIIEPKNCKLNNIHLLRAIAVKMCDILVDGKYIDELRDITLAYRGSSNQRVIDIQKSIKKNKVILYD